MTQSAADLPEVSPEELEWLFDNWNGSRTEHGIIIQRLIKTLECRQIRDAEIRAEERQFVMRVVSECCADDSLFGFIEEKLWDATTARACPAGARRAHEGRTEDSCRTTR